MPDPDDPDVILGLRLPRSDVIPALVCRCMPDPDDPDVVPCENDPYVAVVLFSCPEPVYPASMLLIPRNMSGASLPYSLASAKPVPERHIRCRPMPGAGLRSTHSQAATILITRTRPGNTQALSSSILVHTHDAVFSVIPGSGLRRSSVLTLFWARSGS